MCFNRMAARPSTNTQSGTLSVLAAEYDHLRSKILVRSKLIMAAMPLGSNRFIKLSKRSSVRRGARSGSLLSWGQSAYPASKHPRSATSPERASFSWAWQQAML
eukprot:CAMPEP_0119101138 /NCGR_PEP_ID=MMETSP1180-20130426/268_1 /TAXON_ID=3052 ORGANISM="Chlamydomonas cf sp, Strain CCMP681" /NCGR_SAMPLE_ID=MMETSP1180 /ASSEMBLY_ACC=CAM_ASM_000741 /LENGTH=103 /DNA_ID=CAMNT_0007085201 /DNA_START=270 /DNA_END=581 /DNA_ORIENTATION=-